MTSDVLDVEVEIAELRRKAIARRWRGPRFTEGDYELIPFFGDPPLRMPRSSGRLTLRFPNEERSALVVDDGRGRLDAHCD